jgi:ATP-dependent RNA helicase DeaD
MLDLGFLEDVERILAITPNSRQTALFSATMPPPIRALADRYLYDPVTVKVKSATLTVDSVEQFSVDVKPGDKADKLIDVLRAEHPEQAIVFTRTKIRCDQLYRRLRDRGLNVKALHGDMSQGSATASCSLQGPDACRSSCHRRRRPRPRHLDGHHVDQLRRAHEPRRLRAPHRAHGPRRALGRGDHLHRAAQQRELAAIERHIGTGITPWAEGAHVEPAPVAERPRRHSKPQLSATATSRRPSSSPASAAPRASRSPISSRDHGRRRDSTARPCATCACSSTSRSLASRAATPSASSTPSTARRSTAPRCASRSRAPERRAVRTAAALCALPSVCATLDM